MLLAVLVLLAGCHNAPQKAQTTGKPPGSWATPGAEPDGEPTATPTPAGPEPISAAAVRRARKLPLEQRVGQLFVVGFKGVDLSAEVFAQLRAHGWGGIVVGPSNAFDLAGVGLFAGEARVIAQQANRVVPLVASFDDARPPRLGSDQREGRIRAADAAADAKAQGVTLTTAPFIDVGLGADPDLISRVAPVAVKAWLDGGVAPAPGHFPGQGTVTQDPLAGPANVGLTEQDLRGRDLKPFRTALKEAPAVTVSSATFTAYDPVTPAALTPAIVEGLLRRDLRFGGVAMTDDLSSVTAATGGTPGDAAVAALKAGIDLVYVPDARQVDVVYSAVLKAVRSGRIPAGRVREAAARVLALKAVLR
ncbi:MAG: glycoside hydrolase family 3 N-terminal domain-containing protein [Solirubrobacteraceae bacterium]